MKHIRGSINGAARNEVKNMEELNFPVSRHEKDKFQVIVDVALYAKESIVATCYKFTDRFYVHQQMSGDKIVVIFTTNIIKFHPKKICEFRNHIFFSF